MRDLTPNTQSAAKAQRAEYLHLLELEFSGGTLRFTSGPTNVTVDPVNPYAVRIGATTGRYLIRNPVGTWPTTNLSIEFWGRLDTGLSTSQPNYGVSYAQQTTQFNELVAHVESSGGNWRQTLTVNGVTTLDADNYPNDNAWHHLAFTWRSSDGAVAMYLDGALAHSASGVKTGYSLPGGGVLVLGQDQDSAGGSFDATQAWKGELDDVRVYSRVITAQEVAEHKAGVFTNDTGLVGCWTFNSPTAETLDNPGGEVGASGWLTGAGMTVVNEPANARTGSWCLKYAADGAGGPNFINASTLKVEPGDQLFVSAWMLAPTGTGTTGLAIRWRTADQTQISRDVVGSLTGPVAAYTRVSGFATAPAGAVYAVFDLGENTADNTATPWYFDDCTRLRVRHIGSDTSTAGNDLTAVGITDGTPDTHGATVWSAAGGAMTFEAVNETPDPSGQRLKIILDGVSLGAISALLAQDYIGRAGRVYRGHLGADGHFVSEPMLLWFGYMNAPWDVSEDWDHQWAKVETELVSPLAIMDQVRGITADENSHQAHFPGDTFFSHITTKPEGDFGWGVFDRSQGDRF